MTKKAIALFFCFFNICISYSQDDIELTLIQKYAENSFRDGDYEFALENYTILYKKDKSNVDLNYRIGICYTETTIDKSMAIRYLEFVVGHNNYPIKSFYYLGRAYMYNYRFTQAVEAFYEYKMMGVSEETINETDRLIQMCYDALERINVPKNVTFELLGGSVNSEFDDYYPFIDETGNNLVFSSNRTYVEEFEEYVPNVFYADYNKGNWSEALPLPTNTYDAEEIVGMSTLGDKILMYTNGDYATHDIKMAYRKGNRFTDASSNELPFDLNTDGFEKGACISPDGNTLYFASDRRGGRGSLDLYMAKKDQSGAWMASENLGSIINTEFDENFPSLSADGKKLYFASKGHPGFGEYDIFVTTYIDSLRMWTTPLNIGFPINTPLDNTTISYMPDGKTAYLSTNRKEGIGKLDIYKITFGESAEKYLQVTVMIGNESSAVSYSEDFLKAYGTIYDQYDNIIAQIPVESEGGYFFGTLFPGTYKLEVKFDGYQTGHTETLIVKDSDEIIYSTVYLQQ